MAGDQELMMSLGLTVTQISYSPTSVRPLLDSGMLPCLVHALSLPYMHPLVGVVVELAWNLLERDTSAVRGALILPQPRLELVAAGRAGELTTSTYEDRAVLGESIQDEQERVSAPDATADQHDQEGVRHPSTQTGAVCILPALAAAMSELFKALLLQVRSTFTSRPTARNAVATLGS
jgi:hypothetical protein